MLIEAYNIPHDSKQEFFGEDGYFIHHKNNKVYLCVFDGVGGWANQGVNVKDFVNELIKNCIVSIELGHRNPEVIIEDALNKSTLAGSVTVIFAIIEENSMIVYQIGDSGMMVIQKERVIFQTDSQQHSFNFPYQVGKDKDGSFHGDSPKEGKFYRMSLLNKGDYIILGSDGLFDNLHTHKIINMTQESHVAESLCKEAYKESKQESRSVPFYEQAYKEGVLNTVKNGGKQDDITAIVVKV